MSRGSSRCTCRTEVYSRVVGYYRPVSEWNHGKRAEFGDRVAFDLAAKKKAPKEGGK